MRRSGHVRKNPIWLLDLEPQLNKSIKSSYLSEFMMSTQESGGGLTKWQIAALIGVPVATACVLGALYYWKSSKSAQARGDAEKGTASEGGVPENEAPKENEDTKENRVQ